MSTEALKLKYLLATDINIKLCIQFTYLLRAILVLSNLIFVFNITTVHKF
jgi:hypothetical protein